jgi:hypothetical protein
MPAEIERRECGSRMIIHIPVEQSPATLYKALVVLRNPHNHPMHPRTKPTAEDKFKLGAAGKATGLNGLTVQKLLNDECSSLRLGSTAFMMEVVSQRVRRTVSSRAAEGEVAISKKRGLFVR